MPYLKANDTVCGQEGWATMTIKQTDGTSRVEKMFWIKNLEAKIDVDKTEIYTLGKRGAQHKMNGWKGSGSMTIYYTTSLFRELMLQYVKEGKPAYFDIMVENTDPGSTIGRQAVMLKTCSMDSMIFAKLDVEQEVLDENVDFTFDDVDILEKYVEPELGS